MNLNTRVSVDLTIYGNYVYFCWLKKFDLPMNRAPKEFPLWQLMNIFGECLHMGNTDIPFVNNEIKVLE